MIHWYLNAVVVHVRRLKFRVMWEYLIDGEFRAEINRLYQIRPLKPFKCMVRHVPFQKIKPSHKVIYHRWVEKLENDIREGIHPRPIHCVRVGDNYHIVDGHHRFAALGRIESLRAQSIPVVLREY